MMIAGQGRLLKIACLALISHRLRRAVPAQGRKAGTVQCFKPGIGDIVLSGVMEPQDSGVCALAKAVMVIGDMPCSKFIRPSAEVFDFTGVMEAF